MAATATAMPAAHWPQAQHLGPPATSSHDGSSVTLGANEVEHVDPFVQKVRILRSAISTPILGDKNIGRKIRTVLSTEILAPTRKSTFTVSPTLPAPPQVFNITDENIGKVLEPLIAAYGRSPHAAFLDDSYHVFLTGDQSAAICFKISRGVAVVYGDPVCAAQQVGSVFDTFCRYAKTRGWRVVVVAASPVLAHAAQQKKWRGLEFAVENVMNPQTNAILHGAAGKTVRRVNRNLAKAGVKVQEYNPAEGSQPQLEYQLAQVYHNWRNARPNRNLPNTHATCLDPFALPGICRYLYTTNKEGIPNSFACLMQIGGPDRFLIEPCIAAADAPKGVTELLAVTALEILKKQNATYLTFGFAPLPELGYVMGIPDMIAGQVRSVYVKTFEALGLGGKKAFHEKFKPDDEQRCPSYLLFPPGMPHAASIKATLEVTHISMREVWRRTRAERKAKKAAKQQKSTETEPRTSSSEPETQSDSPEAKTAKPAKTAPPKPKKAKKQAEAEQTEQKEDAKLQIA